eukprot:3311406-Prymnesium_polylepis.1
MMLVPCSPALLWRTMRAATLSVTTWPDLARRLQHGDAREVTRESHRRSRVCRASATGRGSSLWEVAFFADPLR